MSGQWLARGTGRAACRVRLFCFAHAGGGSQAYWPWHAEMLPDIEVCPIVLPGRESRLREPCFTRIHELAPVLAEALIPFLDRPFALFGHSLGAAIAYEMGRILPKEPLRLLVSGRRAPHLPARRPIVHTMPSGEFLATVAGMGGTPSEVLADQALMALFLPGIRSDFELNETYRPAPGPPLTCPVSAFTGVDDPEAGVDEVAAWRETTIDEFELRVFPGAHFYLHDRRQEVLAAIRADLLRE